jgi:hypothetical protein
LETGSERIGEIVKGIGEVMSSEEGRVTIRVPKTHTARLTERVLASLPVIDLTVEDPPIDDVIERVFAAERLSTSGPAATDESELKSR